MSIRQSRRVFLEGAGFGAAGLMGSSWFDFARAAEENATPDLVVINAKVTTMDDAVPRAEAFAIRADRFIAVGSTTDMKSLAGPKTRIYDAKGMMVVPVSTTPTITAAAKGFCTACWPEIPMSWNMSRSRASSTS